jgi:hypothetical protein
MSRCAAGQDQTAETLCELGATATDDQDGNLTHKVLACPPDSCIAAGCPGHEFQRKGLEGCLNTSAPVGTIFNVSFVVFDSEQPPLRANAFRLVTIAQPCAADEFWCGATTGCSPVDCETRTLLLASDGDSTPPVLTPLHGTALTLQYGVISATLSLLPCATYNSTEGCGAVAWDGEEGDVTPYIEIAQVCRYETSPSEIMQ